MPNNKKEKEDNKSKKSKEEKKEDMFDFISDNSSKDDFVHWLLNNTEATVSKNDEWSDIKKEVLENKKISHSKLRDYSITLNPEKDTEAALNEVKKETKKAEEAAEKLTFLGKLKKFSIATGGIIIFLALINLAGMALIIFKPTLLSLTANPTIDLIIAIFFGLSGIVQILGGLFLMAK